MNSKNKHHGFLVALLLTMIPLIRISASLDSHMVGGWLILATILVAGVFSGNFHIQKRGFWIISGLIVLALFQIWLGRTLNLEDFFLMLMLVLALGVRGDWPLNSDRSDMKRGIIIGLVMNGILLLILLIKASVSRGYSHETTYSVQPLFAHRNIIVESCMLWFYWLLNQSDNKRQARWYTILAGALAFVFQARSAMMMWVIMVAVQHKKLFTRNHIFTRIGALGLVFFCLLQLTIALLPAHIYKPIFDQLPDNLKAIDIAYNLNEARSSSDRIELWKWTCENLNTWGHGIGQWRADAQGEVNERIGRCDLFVRHAHSDLLECLYELGVIPSLILFSTLLVFARRQLGLVFVFLPLLLFSFPTERPEIMAALAFSMFTGRRCEEPLSGQNHKMKKALSFALVSVTFIGISSWAYSQHLFGKFFTGKADISQLNSCQQIVVALYPQDLLNNSLALYQAHYLIAHQNIDGAVQILEERLHDNSKDLGVQKQLLEIDPSAYKEYVYCNQISKP